MNVYSGLRTRKGYPRFLLFILGVVCAFVLGFSGPAMAQAKAKEAGPKIYHVPASMIKAHIEKTKGRKRVLFVWKSTDEFSRRVLPEYSTLERAKPGSVISISLDDKPLRVTKFLQSIQEETLKTLVVKKTTGDSIDDVLAELGVKPFKGYPLVITLDEDNVIQEQGKLYIDYVADYILTDKPKKVQAP